MDTAATVGPHIRLNMSLSRCAEPATNQGSSMRFAGESRSLLHCGRVLGLVQHYGDCSDCGTPHEAEHVPVQVGRACNQPRQQC